MGIGESIATSLADAGAHLILFSRSENKLAVLVKSLTARNPKSVIIFRPVDIQDFEAINEAIKSSIAEVGEIDFLINNGCISLSFTK